MSVPGTEYDLTRTITPFLDRHMVLSLVEFLEKHKIYPADQLAKAKLDVIDKTKMVDLKLKEHKAVCDLETKAGVNGAKERYEAVSTRCKKEKEEVVTQYKKFKKMIDPMLASVESSGLANAGTDPEKVEEFKKKHMIDQDSLKSLYAYGRLAFDIGRYSDAVDMLAVFLTLNNDADSAFLALWGKVAAQLLLAVDRVLPEHALPEIFEDLSTLREAIGRRLHVPRLQQLVQRSWLIFWALFAYFQSADSTAGLVKFLLQEKLLNAVQMRCPCALRYLVAGVMISYDQSKMHIKQVMDLIEMERETYRDPLTEFLRKIWLEYDFEGAHRELVECEKVFNIDFFLAKPDLKKRFMKNARHLMFELYCRIHKRVDISVLAKQLNLDQKDTDKALVELIQAAPFDGKIDSKKNQLVMATQYPSIYQKVIEKTKGLAHRTQQLAAGIEKRLQLKLSQRDN